MLTKVTFKTTRWVKISIWHWWPFKPMNPTCYKEVHIGPIYSDYVWFIYIIRILLRVHKKKKIHTPPLNLESSQLTSPHLGAVWILGHYFPPVAGNIPSPKIILLSIHFQGNVLSSFTLGHTFFRGPNTQINLWETSTLFITIHCCYLAWNTKDVNNPQGLFTKTCLFW